MQIAFSDKLVGGLLTTLRCKALKLSYSRMNFLKKTFLDSCQRAGLFGVKE